VSSKRSADSRPLADVDPELAAALEAEREREETCLELIASENYASARVLEALGSTLTNKYADGYPGRRTYSGCEAVDRAETLAIERARELFGAAYVNVQPYSGSQANEAVYQALLAPGETLLAMSPAAGGHNTHGAPQSFSGRDYHCVHYGVVDGTGEVDYAGAAALAEAHRPKLVVAGFSAHTRIIDWRRFRAIADSVGARLLVDMAHVAGLVAAGIYPDPVPVADVVTTTTHKTLRGPRGGMILSRDVEMLGPLLDTAVYPGVQGGPLMHVVAAKAVAFKEALTPDFRLYQQTVVANAKRMAEVFAERGIEVWSGGTDNHMLLLDLGDGGGARAAEAALEHAGLAVSRFEIPGRPGGRERGLRLGTPAITTRGLGATEAAAVAHLVADVIAASGTAAAGVVAAARAEVDALCARFPVYT